MDAGTYPNQSVAELINDEFIAVRIRSDSEPYVKNFNVSWTPRIIILDPMGKTHQSTVGFFPPEEFIPALVLGLAKVDFDAAHLEACLKHLDCILSSHVKSAAAPEAVFYKGVTEYKISGKAEPLKEAYHKLKEQYTDSEWVFRASPYRLL